MRARYFYVLLIVNAIGLAIIGTDSEAKGIKVKIPRGVGLHGRPIYGPDVLKPEQLEQCLRIEKDVGQSADFLDATELTLKAKAESIDQLGKELDRSTVSLERTNQSAINIHNAKVGQYNKMVEEYRSQEQAYNDRVRLHNASIDQFNASCANKKYYESDMKTAREKVGS